MPIAGIYGPDDFGNPVHGHPAAQARSRVTAAERARALPMPSLQWTAGGRARHRASLRAGQERDPAGRVAVHRALCQGDQRAEARRATPSSWRTITRRRKSSIASPTSSAIRCSSRSRPPRSKSDIIVQCGVHFMAETSKILNPDKTVLIPDSRAGCSLASIDHRRRRAAVARALSRRAGRRLCQHLSRREGGGRYLLHLVQRGAGGGEPRCADR